MFSLRFISATLLLGMSATAFASTASCELKPDQMTQCGLQCMQSSDGADSCRSKCLSALGLDIVCAKCLGENIACAITKCPLKCGLNPASGDCTSCVSSSCTNCATATASQSSLPAATGGASEHDQSNHALSGAMAATNCKNIIFVFMYIIYQGLAN